MDGQGSEGAGEPAKTPAPSDDRNEAGSPLALPAFQRYGERFLARHLNAVRLSRAQRPDFTAARDRPLLIYLNRSSWWDPLICLQLASQVLSQRRHFAPIAAGSAPAAGRLFARLGFFPLDPYRARDTRRLLDIATHVLDQPDATLWLAPGDAADPRRRPVELHPWLGHLVCKLRRGVLLPLAVEYPFWGAQLPEALLRFGEELAIEDAGMRARDWSTVLAAQLQEAQDALAAEALSRDASRFETIQCPDATSSEATSSAPAARLRRVQGLWHRIRGLLYPRPRRLSGNDPEEST